MSDVTTYAAVVLLIVVGALGAGAALEGGTHEFTDTDGFVVGDSINYSEPAAVTVSQTPVTEFYDTENVTNATGDQLIEGTDYDWNTSTGELTLINTSSTSDGDSVEIVVDYAANTDRSQSIGAVLELVYRVLAIGFLLGAGYVVIQWTGLVGGNW